MHEWLQTAWKREFARKPPHNLGVPTRFLLEWDAGIRLSIAKLISNKASKIKFGSHAQSG